MAEGTLERSEVTPGPAFMGRDGGREPVRCRRAPGTRPVRANTSPVRKRTFAVRLIALRMLSAQSKEARWLSGSVSTR
jgi:hypothetical protein